MRAKSIGRVIASIFLLSLCVPLGYAQVIGQLEFVPRNQSRDSVKRLIAARAYSEADAELARLLSGAPRDSERLILQALNFFYEHRYVESRFLVQRIIAQQPATAEVRVLSGLLYVVANDLGAAEPEFRMATEADSNNAAAHYYFGRTLYMRQAIDPSLAEFKQALAIDPNFIQAYDAIGLAYVVKEKPAEAKDWFVRGMQQEQLRDGPRLDWLPLDLAAMLLTYHRGAEAEVYLTEAEQINPSNPQVYSERGQMYFQDLRYSDAITAYWKVLQLDPLDARAHYFLGRAYHILGQDAPSKAEFDRFVQLNRQHTMLEPNSSIATRDSPVNGVR